MQRSEQHHQLRVLLFYSLMALLGYLVFRVFQPFLAPLGWAVVLVVVCYPVHERIAARLGPTWAAALSTLAVALLLILPSLALATAFVREAAWAAGQVNSAITPDRLARAGRLWTWVQEWTIGRPGLDLATLAQQTATAFASWAASQAGAVLRDAVLFIADLFITLFAVFFLFRDGATMMRGVRRVLPFDERQRERMIGETRGLIYATVTSGFIVAAVQGVLGGITFALLGISASLFWGVVTAFCALLPVGAGIVWAPMAIWLLTTGRIVQGVVLIGIGAGVISLVDNFLRPILLSGRSQLSGLLVFMSLIGGIAVFGLLGLVLGPVVVATTVGILEAHAETKSREEPTAGQ